MGFWTRLRGIEEKPETVRVTVVGDGAEAGSLLEAYHAIRGVEATAASREQLLEQIGRRATDAVEICLPPEEAQEVARAGLRAGLFVSTPCPLSRSRLAELVGASRPGSLRVRLAPLYYPPYRELMRLVEEDAVGTPVMLKLAVRRGRGTVLPDPLDPADWLRRHELGFLALSPWLIGPAERADSRLESIKVNGAAASSVLTWKYPAPHQYGYLQLDFCPDLHVRTFHEPVHRGLELTGLGGIISVNRAEGQLLREPTLVVRGKSTTTAFELIPDDWDQVYANLAVETVAVTREGKPPTLPTDKLAEQALRVLELAL